MFKSDPKPEPRQPKERKPIKKWKAATGELEIFKILHKELNGKSQITGKYLPFDVKNFIHCLSKGARPDLRLVKENIIHAEFVIHFSYDNYTEENTLKKFPNAKILYEKRNELKKMPVKKK